MLTPLMRMTVLTGSVSRAAGGMFESVRNLTRAVKERGRYSVSVVGLEDPETERDSALWLDIKTEACPVAGPYSFGYAPRMARALEANRPQIVHVHGLWIYPSVVAARWSGTCKPYVVSPHGMLDSWALRNSGFKKSVCSALYENRHLRGASCLHALNQAEASAIRDYGLINPICVVPNGVEPSVGAPLRQVGGRKTLLYLGRLHPKKGLTSLIEAWSVARSQPEASDWHLKIAGWDQNNHEFELRALVSKFGLHSSVTFSGPQFEDRKDTCFSEASAFVLPSLSEGLPMTVLEAWSWQLPVLMTPQCNLPEGGTAKAAIMMDPNPMSILNALRALFKMSTVERDQVGAMGLKLVEDRYQWPKIGHQMTDVYNWLLGHGPKPDCVID